MGKQTIHLTIYLEYIVELRNSLLGADNFIKDSMKLFFSFFINAPGRRVMERERGGGEKRVNDDAK